MCMQHMHVQLLHRALGCNLLRSSFPRLVVSRIQVENPFPGQSAHSCPAAGQLPTLQDGFETICTCRPLHDMASFVLSGDRTLLVKLSLFVSCSLVSFFPALCTTITPPRADDKRDGRGLPKLHVLVSKAIRVFTP